MKRTRQSDCQHKIDDHRNVMKILKLKMINLRYVNNEITPDINTILRYLREADHNLELPTDDKEQLDTLQYHAELVQMCLREIEEIFVSLYTQ